MKPPTVKGAQVISFTGSTPVLGMTGVGASADRTFNIISTLQFDIIFSSDGTANIPDASLAVGLPFPTRTLLAFVLGPKNTHFKVVTSGTVFFKYWLGPTKQPALSAPTVSNTVLTSVGAGVVTSIPVGPVSGRRIAICGNNTFDLAFSDDGSDVNIPAPGASLALFASRQIYEFDLGPKNTHYKVANATSVTVKHWVGL